MKKKLLALFLAAVMVIGAAVGGTLAYLTSEDNSINVATTGNVKIEQHEMQRNDDGTALVDFKQGQPLYPAYPNVAEGVNAYEQFDNAALTMNGVNYKLWNKLDGSLDKIVYVENTGRSDAYFRTWIALECPGDMKLGTEIRVNVNDTDIDWVTLDKKYTIDGQDYAIMCATYKTALEAGAISAPSLLQVVMDPKVGNAVSELVGNTYEILAFTEACQTKNMPSYAAALEAAFDNDIPWDAEWVKENDISDYVDSFNFVANAAELTAALEAGESVTLTDDIVLEQGIVIEESGMALFSRDNEGVVLDLNGNTISMVYTGEISASHSLITNKGNLTIKDSKGGGKISYTFDGTADREWAYAVTAISNVQGTLTIKGGTIESLSLSTNSKGENTNVYKFTIDNLTNANAGDAVLNVEGGVITAAKGGPVRGFANSTTNYVVINISGGEFVGQVWLQNPSSKANLGEINISGGKFQRNIADVAELKVDSGMTATVTGGTFASDPAAFIDAGKSRVVANSNGTFEVLPRYSYKDINGSTYAVDEANNGELTLYVVPAEYEGDTVIVAEGTAKIGNYAFSKNNNVKTVVLPDSVTDLGRGFDTSYVEKVVLNEGLTVVSSRAFRDTKALKEVTFSSTVTTIADNAFQKSAIKTITIPANVKTIGETAFGASLVETVIIEGNTDIEGYAFRGCTKLRTVYLYGDDVNFVKSTLNGRNSIWFCNGESNNPNTSNITFYVQNETVAARVKTAMGAEANNTKIIIISSDSADLNETIQSGAKDIYLAAGTYTLPSSKFTAGTTLTCAPGTVFAGKSSLDVKGATIIGATFANEGGEAVSGTINGTFVNCTFTGNETIRWCYTTAGTTTVFENCVIETTLRGIHFDEMNGTVIFRNCKIAGFNAYSGSGNMIFENCEFGYDKSNYNGLNIYTNTTITNCTFEYVSGKTNFIDLEGTGKNLTITGCTATLDGKAIDVATMIGGSKLTQNTVVVDGKVVVSTAAQLAEAVANGATNLYLKDGEYDVYGCAGKTLTLTGSKNAVLVVVNEGEYGCDYGFDGATVTFNNIVFDTVSKNASNWPCYARMNGTFNGCTFNGSYAANRVSSFKDCTFNVTGNTYNLWLYGASKVTFDGCTFNCDGKSIYIDGNGAAGTDVTVNYCVFNDNGDDTVVNDKAAIETGKTYGSRYELIVNNTTVNGFVVNPTGISTNSTVWANKHSMGTDVLNVVIDGVDVY